MGGRREGAETASVLGGPVRGRRHRKVRALNSKAFVESLSAGAEAGRCACAEQQVFVEAYPRVRTQESARELSSKGVGRGTNPIPRAFAARQTDNRKFSRRRS